MTAWISCFDSFIWPIFIWYPCNWSVFGLWNFLWWFHVQIISWDFWVFRSHWRIQDQLWLTGIKKQNVLNIWFLVIFHPVAFYQNTWNKYVSVYRGCCVLKWTIFGKFCCKLFQMKKRIIGKLWFNRINFLRNNVSFTYLCFSQEPPCTNFINTYCTTLL